MAATKNVVAGSPSAADTLELGTSGGIVQVAAGCDLYLLDIGAITASETSTQAAGTALSYTVNNVTVTSGDNDAVTLPTAVAGLVRIVYCLGPDKALVVFPASGDDINDGTTDAAVILKELTWALFVAIDGTTWAAQYTVNS